MTDSTKEEKKSNSVLGLVKLIALWRYLSPSIDWRRTPYYQIVLETNILDS